MGRPKKRAKSSTVKRKKISEVKKRPVVLLRPPLTYRRQSAEGQLVRKNYARAAFKHTVLIRDKKWLTKEQKKLLAHIKKYKSVVARKYNKELVSSMKKKGYFKFQIKHAKKYSYVGKKVRTEVDKMEILNYNRSLTKGLVNGKWKTIKQIESMRNRKIKAARIKAYKEILGITDKRAKQIFLLIEKKSPAANAYLALIY